MFLNLFCIYLNTVIYLGELYGFGSGHKGKLGNLMYKWGFHLNGKEDIKTPYKIGGIQYDDIDHKEQKVNKMKNTNYFKDVIITQALSSAIHSGVIGLNTKTNNQNIYTFGCGSDGRMGLNMKSKSGEGTQTFKFYVSKPTIIDAFTDKTLKPIQIGSGRRHMIALIQDYGE